MEAVMVMVMAYLPKVALALAVAAAFWFGGKIAEAVIRRMADKDSQRRDILLLLGRSAAFGLSGFGVVCGLGTLGVDVTAIIAGLGLTGFALGFALKDMLSSALAGVMLLLSRPFVSGDRILVTGFEGIVQGVDLRYVTLADGDKKYLVPNSAVIANPVTVLPREAPAAAE